MSVKSLTLSLVLFVLFVPFSIGEPAIDVNSAGGNGRVTGTVKDSSGAVLSGARIMLQPTATTVASDALGHYLIGNVKPGTYTLTVSYLGFAPSVTTITVTSGQTILDVSLTVGSASQQVEVNATLEGDAASINEQRVSDNILDVQN